MNAKQEKPVGIFQNVVARAYPIILAALTVFTIIKLPYKKLRCKMFLTYLGIGALFGCTWNFFIMNIDPTAPGWIYHPWAIVGLSWHNMVLEDFVFYVICGAFFYLIRSLVPNIGTSSARNKRITIIALSMLALYAVVIFDTGGRSIALWFAYPGIIMLILSRDSLNLPRFFIVGMFVVLFASAWDILAITIIPSIGGYDWASQWVYITYHDGIVHHSGIWLDYNAHRWAWIGNSPIEITPWFGIAGWIFIYSLANILEDRIK